MFEEVFCEHVSLFEMESVGTNHFISILDELWLQNGRCIDRNIPNAPLLQNYTVNSLIDTAHQRWNMSLVNQIFSEDIATEIA